MKTSRAVKVPNTHPGMRLLMLSLLSLSPATAALAEDAALITGYSISSEKPREIPYDEATMEGLENVADLGLSMALHRLGIDPGSSEYNDITSAVNEFWESAQPQEQEVERSDHIIVYLSCMMEMSTPTQSMAIRLPPGESIAYMESYDSSTGEGFVMELNRELDKTSALTGAGWNSGINMTPTGTSESYIGYEAEVYTFEYSGGLGNKGGVASSPEAAASQGGLAGIASMVSVTNSGTAWVSDEVPGVDIVRTFYENFSNTISAGQDSESFYGGLMKSMVGMLQYGMPLHTSQTTQSKIMGQTRMAGQSESWVTSADVISWDPGRCSQTIIPDDVEVTQINTGALPGSGGPGGEGGSDPGSGSGSNPGGSPGGSVGEVEQACDCSCEAMMKLQDPDTPDEEKQAMAMCIMECASQFMACAMNAN